MMNFTKRKLMTAFASWPWLMGCSQMVSAQSGQDPLQRFRGIGVVLVCDAVPDVRLLGVEFYDDRHAIIFNSSALSKRNRSIMALGGARVPLTVRVVWHDSSKIVGRKENPNLDTYDGNIIGDYTLPIAARIPDEVLQEIRAHGGALRLKFRLKSDGVLFGWDIERHTGGAFTPLMPGGDFLEMKY
jgi:hypothetical protein